MAITSTPRNELLSGEDKKTTASTWFQSLRDQICKEFEEIELEYAIANQMGHSERMRFVRTRWQHPQGGGGEMSLMKGRVFEKVGVNISTVHGELPDALRRELPGGDKDPKFWASGISLVAHMCSPLVPAVHMNTRMIITGDNSKLWFGGGADLTPLVPQERDTQEFHGAFRRVCDAFHAGYYEKFKKACDEYFFIKHRNEPRGVGGIFYDYLNSGTWKQDFAFTQEVGTAFAHVYPKIVTRHMHEPYTKEQREALLVKRGRYVEFNLLYDRGTRFGLYTQGNPDAILMSMPPEVKWP